MQHQTLVDLIRAADHAYYSGSGAIMTDQQYDHYKDMLAKTQPKHELLDDLGDDHTEGFTRVKRDARYPMLSLGKIQEAESEEESKSEIRNWISEVTRQYEIVGSCVVEPKFDGCAVEALYRDGKLVRALTRGNGVEGDDITENVTNCFPPKINIPGLGTEFALRGEICISKQEFTRINEWQHNAYANARNLCAGRIKGANTLASKRIRLDFILYHYVDIAGDGIYQSLDEALNAIYENTNIPNIVKSVVITEELVFGKGPHAGTINELAVDKIFAEINRIKNTRTELDYEIDGAVLKFTNFGYTANLGCTNHHPRWAFAYKFLPTLAHATVTDIQWSFGSKTGRATPVAVITPTYVDGSTITRVSLSNAGLMAKKGVKVGSVVEIRKAKEIIPEVVRVIDGEAYDLEPGLVCPGCNSVMELTDGTPQQVKEGDVTETYIPRFYTCNCPSCPEKLMSRMSYAWGKNALNALGFGPEVCREFYNKFGYVDVPRMLKIPLADYPISGRNAENLYQEIQQAYNAPLERWIVAMQFKGISNGTARTISSMCKDWYTFINYVDWNDWLHIGLPNKNQLDSIQEDVREAAQSIATTLGLTVNPESDNYSEAEPLLLEKWLTVGLKTAPIGTTRIQELCKRHKDWKSLTMDIPNLTIPGLTDSDKLAEVRLALQALVLSVNTPNFNPTSSYAVEEGVSQRPLENYKVVVTGSFFMGRNNMERHIEMLGGKLQSAVNAKTDIVVFGEYCGANKRKGAEEHGGKPGSALKASFTEEDVKLLTTEPLDTLGQRYNWFKTGDAKPRTGYKVVVTGTFGIGRENVEALVRNQLGDDVMNGGVTGNTDYVIVGSAPGPNKVDKIAALYGQPGNALKMVFTEQEFLDYLAKNP